MRINDLPKYMAICLSLTIIVEVIVGLICGIRDKKDIINVLLVNVLTNPLVVSIPVLVLIRYGVKNYYIVFYLLEVLTVFVEGFIYLKVLKYRKINSFILSLLLNLSSFLLGKIIW